MQSAISLTLCSSSPITRLGCTAAAAANAYFCTPRSLQFCGLRRDVFESKSFNSLSVSTRLVPCSRDSSFKKVHAALQSNGKLSKGGFDYDLVIIGTGVGGHGAALHAVENFIDDSDCSSLCCLLSELIPVEIVKPAKLLNLETETVFLRHTRNPLVNELLPLV